MNELTVPQVKGYLDRVVNLEGSLYEQQKIYNSLLEKKQKYENMKLEERPIINNKDSSEDGLFLAGFAAVVDFILILCFDWVDSFGGFVFHILVVGGLTLFITKFLQRAYYSNQQEKSDKYYYERVNKIKEKNKEIIDKCKSCMAIISKSIDSTKNTLDSVYNLNIVYPKYRNFVAMATICEYFDSGRVDQFVGPNGAYNLYENELRMNVIIDKLDMILEKLDTIQRNQNLLYLVMNKINSNISSMNNHINRLEENLNSMNTNIAMQTYADLRIQRDVAYMKWVNNPYRWR